ncbi:DUF1343 domain-containing protein, partial [bacterium]
MKARLTQVMARMRRCVAETRRDVSPRAAAIRARASFERRGRCLSSFSGPGRRSAPTAVNFSLLANRIPERRAELAVCYTPCSMSNTLPGLDVIVAGHEPHLLRKFSNRKLGLLTNQTGLTLNGIPAWEALGKVGFNILALFSPEHGPRGVLEGEIASSQMEDGTPIHSLYGATKRPTPEMLQGLDALVCDLQDVGARFYTYGATIFEVMEACAPLGIAVIILDRPNPLGGLSVEGPLIETELMSFIGPAPLPVTHGLTLGEMALF